MDKVRPASVDEYIASQPTASHLPLRRVRAAIRRALPGADEVISYGIPAYRHGGRIVIYFAGWKTHYAIYPLTARVTAALGAALDKYDQSGKGTIRFPLDAPVPGPLIGRIAKLRAAENAARKIRKKR
jgi:uncharacterized protein YdhG (YjbR/CyaY superfamily)